MNIVGITVNDFLCHSFKHISLEDGITGIIGENGSGKSSLVIDSVTWCIFGKSRAPGAGDDLIRSGSAECKVTVYFTVGDVEYGVTRIRTRSKKTDLIFERQEFSGDNFVDLSRPTIKATQDLIEKTIGMTYDVFKNSCCVEQGNMNSFSLLTPFQASSVLYDILQLNRYVTYRNLVNDKLRGLSIEKDTLDRQLVSLNESLAQCEDINKTRNILSSKISGLLSHKHSLEINLELLNKDKDTISANTEVCLSKIESEKNIIQILNDRATRIKSQLNILDEYNSSCPVCESSLSDNGTYAKTKLSQELDVILHGVELHELELKKAKEELLVHITSTKNLGIESVQSKIAECKDELIEATSRLETLTHISQDYKTVLSNKVNTTNQLNKITSDIDICNTLLQAFSPKGIPLLIIDHCMSELKVLINDNLKLMCDLPLSVDIITRKESLQGIVCDTLELKIMDTNYERPYSSYSGGEKTILDLSVRLGLSELLARRNNFKVETLIIDEGLGTLDDTNQQQFVETLIKLTSKFRKIIVITHTQAKDYLEKTVVLTKNKIGTSTQNMV